MRYIKIGLIIIVFLACIATPVFFTWYQVSIDSCREYGLPELIYYTTQIIGAIATFAAVIVALFGDTFRNVIYGERCEVKLVDDGFSENLGFSAGTSSPEAQSFDCTLKITNSGSKEISDCQILLKEVRYAVDDRSKLRSIKKFEYKPLYWVNPETTSYDLVRGDHKKIPLFKIYPENSCMTPDDSSSSPLRMRVIGCSLDNKLAKSGKWLTTYVVKSSEKVLCTFEVEVWWDGTWHNRFNEMKDCTTAKLKRI